MGQIVFNGQKPKYANKIAITIGTKANTVLDENEIWLIDSTVTSSSSPNVKSSTGTGKYDKYIVGDGHTVAKNLQLHSIDEVDTIPTKLSQLEDDATHRLVTDEDKFRWNNAAAGEGSVALESSEDINAVTNQTTNLTHLEFADKEYNVEEYSGLGRKILRKNLQAVNRKEERVIFDTMAATKEGDTYVTDAVWIKNKWFNSVTDYKGVDITSDVIGKTVSVVPRSDYPIFASSSICQLQVHAGYTYKITAQKSDTAQGLNWRTRFWVITSNPRTIEEDGTTYSVADIQQAYKPHGENFVYSNVQEVDIITAENDGVLWINYVSYDNGQCLIEGSVPTEEIVTINVIGGIDSNNTEYLVQYDYDLNGGLLDLPENTVLNFTTGSIKNGYIRGKNSMIVSQPSTNILEGITLIGSWKNIDFYPKWFGAVADGVTDDTKVLQSMLDISTNISKPVRLIWRGNSFKTTKGLFLKDDTTIIGGSIIAQFENPIDWILQTYSLYDGKIVNPRYIASWQEFDGGHLNHVTGCTIDGLSLNGVLNKHMVIPEGEDETSEKVWDNTYCPIYGGLKLNGASSVVKNVSISNVGIGMARGACLHSYDSHLNIRAKFIAYAARAVNTTIVENSYLNAWANIHNPSATGILYTPYYSEYQGFNRQPSRVFMVNYIEGNGGTGVSGDELQRPLFCSVKMNYAGILFNNTITDSGAEVAFAATNSTLVVNYPYFEGVTKCYVYAISTRVTLTMPEVTSDPAEYDFIGSTVSFNFDNCTYRISGQGGTTGTVHKYALESPTDSVNFSNTKPDYAPNDDRFYYLTNGDDASGFSTASVSGKTLEAQVGKYYTVTSTVNNLAVTLPAMGSVTLLKAVILNLTTGGNPNITFAAADNKTIAYYHNYEIETNSTYEINCMYNGTKWIISASMIG